MREVERVVPNALVFNAIAIWARRAASAAWGQAAPPLTGNSEEPINLTPYTPVCHCEGALATAVIQMDRYALVPRARDDTRVSKWFSLTHRGRDPANPHESFARLRPSRLNPGSGRR